MEKAFGYCRVSGSSQVSGDGFPRQVKAIQDYAKAHGLEIVEIFKDDISGTTESRPELARLMVSLEQNGHGIKTIIIERLDRLARDLMVQEAIVRDFQKHGFNLISALEGPDLCANDPSRKLVRQIMGAVAEYDKTMLVLKLKVSRDRAKLRDGKCEGRKGYADTEEGRAVVHRIRLLRRRPKRGPQLTWQAIADRLNAEGIKSLDGCDWSLYRVQQTATRGQKHG